MVGGVWQQRARQKWGKVGILAKALFHEESVPFAICPFVVDCPGLFVEEGGKGEYFQEGICDDFEENFAGSVIELVCQVEEDSRAGW